MADLFSAIRAEAKPGIWSQGVSLARDNAVVLESRTPSEVVLRVKAKGRPVPWTVVLYPNDDAWECDCPSRVDPCEHCVAGAVALQKEQTQGTEVVAAEKRFARVVYRLSRVSDGLHLERAIGRADGTLTPMDTSLAVLLQNPAEAAQLQVEQHDLNADRMLERGYRGALPADRLESLLVTLENSRNVLLDGKPVGITRERLAPRVIVEDAGPRETRSRNGSGAEETEASPAREQGVRVTLAKDPRPVEVVAAGVALVADTLVRMGDYDPRTLPSTKVYGPQQLGELSAKVIPELARRYPLDIRTTRIPRIDPQLKPRIQIQLTQLESGLSAFPTLVYGAPPHVRIDGPKLVWLQGSVPLRDEAAEQRLIAQLRDQLDMIPGRRATVAGPDVARFADKLRKYSGDLTGDAARLVSPNVTLKARLTPGELFAFDFQVEGGGKNGIPESVSGEAVMRAWSEGLGLLPLDGGGWAPLPAAWLEQHGQRVLDLLAARDDAGKLAPHALPQLAELHDALELPRPPGLEKLKPLVDGFETIPSAPLPAGLQATLRPYQKAGVDWLRFLESAGLGAVLADDMGLGKTLQTICVLEERALVVCPTSVLPNWLAELQRFRPSLKVNRYHGPNRAIDPAADVTVTSYALLRLDQLALQAVEWKTVVLDEAQAIKNPDSQVARAAYGLKAGFRIALSGTPIENRLDELWSVVHFTNRGLLGGRRAFDERWAQPVVDGRPGAAAALRKKVRPFVLRRLKRDVAPELPPKTEAVLHVELDEREKALYQTVFAATRAEIVGLLGGDGKGVLKALEALLRLRQAACHSGLLPGQTAKSSSKVEALVEALSSAVADGHKALVFSQWTSMLDLIEPVLKENEIGFNRLDGSTPDRGAITTEFAKPDGPPVMLISLKAGGTGLNLTAADHVFLVDPWWNPQVEAQATDRAHRIGQDKPVFVYRLVSHGTVEEKILTLQDKKRALFEAALGEGAGAAGGLSKDDLLELLS